jgi:hypothetical protein
MVIRIVGAAFLMAAGLVSITGWADEASTKLKIEDTKPKSGPNAEAIDELITNKNLRAYSGSTSRWSIASMWNYNGGTVKEPFSEDRPNISEASATTVKSDLDGNLSSKYNINVKNSLMAGVGMRWIAPLSKGGPKDYEGTRLDVQNPYIQYQYLYNWGVQSVLQFQVMQWTQADSTAQGYDKQFLLDQENMYEVGDTGLSLGGSVWLQYTTFNKSSPDLWAAQSDYQFGFTPDIEYELTDKLNLRTTFNLWIYEHYKNRPGSTFVHDKIYQSVGLGYSVTRDIFIYPNVQFLPARIASNFTNVGLQATINLF